MRHLATATSIELTASSLLLPILFSASTVTAAAVRVEVPANTRAMLVATVGVEVVVIRR